LKYHQKNTTQSTIKESTKAAIKLQKTKTEIPPVQFCIEKRILPKNSASQMQTMALQYWQRTEYN
jgi:hypothetical protein